MSKETGHETFQMKHYEIVEISKCLWTSLLSFSGFEMPKITSVL